MPRVTMWTTAILLSCLVMSAVRGNMVGYSDDGDWAFTWYPEEPFHFLCDKSVYKLEINSSHYIQWETPTGRILTLGNDTPDFKVTGTQGTDLLVKKVHVSVHGVYKCKLYDNGDLTQTGLAVFGLNVRERKYHKLIDKYRSNIITAFVATAVFLVVFGVPCLVYRFRYQSDEDRRDRAAKKRAYVEFMSDGPGHEMKQPIPEDIAERVRSPDGKGAYDNPFNDLSTQL